jgi:beta-xylosidase
MSPDGRRLLAPSRIVYDGHETQPTIEGTKFYKYNGNYYIFSPAGGVSTGWQVVLKASGPWGPYQERVVMAQGKSEINGPHQGAWIDTPAGEHWFMHFQDKDAYGRVVHLQPMEWTDGGWPVIGTDKDGDGTGEPVEAYRKPALKNTGLFQPAESDTFCSTELGLQWQWHGVPSPYWYYLHAGADKTDADGMGALRLYSVDQAEGWRNLGDSPNLLLQKTPADEFTVTTKLRFVPNPQLKERGENCGFVLMGMDYATVRLTDTPDGIMLQYIECENALKGAQEKVLETVPVRSEDVYIKMEVKPEARTEDVPDLIARFYYGFDGKHWSELTERPFIGKPGKWIGAKFGLYCNRFAPKNDSGWVQIDWINVTK